MRYLKYLSGMCFAALLAVPLKAQILDDPFEPDDLVPLAGALINGASPDFVFPPDIDINLELPEIERWLIQGRDLATPLDIDWFVFYIDQYLFRPLAGQIRIIPTSTFSENNLRVEVATLSRDSLLNFTIVPSILQSCFESPVGESVVTLGEADFLAFYRVRGCPGFLRAAEQAGVEKQPYDFEFEVNDRERAPALVAKLSGTVRDIRNGQAVPGAAVFTQVNDITFGDPDTGLWRFATVNAPSIVLDFLAPGLDSTGPVDIGPVGPADTISNISLGAAPTGLIFFAGFE
ncbi:MAG: hypothetical protein AAF736_11870 [Pseudomonadota bacterium]